jgi:hypothetical protein
MKQSNKHVRTNNMKRTRKHEARNQQSQCSLFNIHYSIQYSLYAILFLVIQFNSLFNIHYSSFIIHYPFIYVYSYMDPLWTHSYTCIHIWTHYGPFIYVYSYTNAVASRTPLYHSFAPFCLCYAYSEYSTSSMS